MNIDILRYAPPNRTVEVLIYNELHLSVRRLPNGGKFTAQVYDNIM